ncbi:MAG: hypothetical protein F9K30_13450 [Dechloromonas sp.]|nr:MAG: hypothetical protein F9K30_13450 [Dechloromonas sp.]
MQVKKLVSLCALACAAMAGQAHAAMSAAEQAIVNDAVNNGRVIFISGASATQKGFTGIIASMFTGTPIRFANTNASSKDFEAVAGVLASGAGPWSGQNVIIIDRVKGGSVFGVDSVARAQAIESLKVTSATCNDVALLDKLGNPITPGTAGNPYVCSTTAAAEYMVPDAGISDVAPPLFKGPINTEGEIAAPSLTAAELALLKAYPIYSLAFGVPVTSNVPMVALNKTAVAAIMAGGIGTWDAVDSTLPADDIVVCRRVPGSGTQAVDNLYFGNFPCGVANEPADRDASEAWDPVARKYTVTPGTGGLVVVENSTSGDVRNCLDKAVTGGTYNTKDRSGQPVVVDFGAGGHKAVGVMSMDSLKDSKSTGNWQFRSLNGAGTYTWDGAPTSSSPETAPPVAAGDGVFPSLANLTDGNWDLQGWISFNIPTRTTGNKLSVLNKFLAEARKPSLLGSISDLKYVAAAIPGNPGVTAGDQTLRVKYVQNNQCAPLNREY